MSASELSKAHDIDIILDYLMLRGVQNEDAELVLRCSTLRIDKETIYKAIDGFEYSIDHVLDASGRIGYDMIDVNKALGLSKGKLLAIALAAGDDPICLDIDERQVIIWLLEEGEYVALTRTLDQFIDMIKMETV